MRTRTPLSFLLVGVLVASIASPSTAGGKKKGTHVQESFMAQALPFPNPSAVTGTPERSCFAGEEGIHKVSHPFTSPGKGELHLSMEGFTGDWDLKIKDAEGNLMGESVNDQVQGSPPEEDVYVKLIKGQEIVLQACNWAGTPEAEVSYEGHFV